MRAGRQDLQLLGTWLYGKAPSKYQVRQTSSGDLEFEGPHTRGGTVTGVLRPQGEWLQADLVSKDGEDIGKIRVRFVKEFGSACSNFKAYRQTQWGKDIFAHREDLALTDSTPQPQETSAAKPKVKRVREVVEVDINEPLLLVGNCNNWNISEAKKKFVFDPKPELLGDGRLSTLRVEVDEDDFTFQVLSQKKTWDWRLYPPLSSKAEAKLDNTDAVYVKVLSPDNPAVKGRNFHILGRKGWSVEVQVWIGDREKLLMQYVDPYDRKAKRWDPAVPNKARPEPPFATDWGSKQRRPKDYLLDEIGPLQLVGECCKWKIESQGLELTPGSAGSASHPGTCWRQHDLCFRMQARTVDFQIISRKLGFSWRLFPQVAGGQRLQRGEANRIESALGGESDGHGTNFILEEGYLTIVVLSVWLEVETGGFGSKVGKVHVSYTAVSSAKPQVGIAPNWIQYPPKELSLIDDEVIQAARTEEEKADVLEQRRNLIRRLCKQLLREYATDWVQNEVFDLRQHYPYHGQSRLTLECDRAVAQEFAPVENGAAVGSSRDPACRGKKFNEDVVAVRDSDSTVDVKASLVRLLRYWEIRLAVAQRKIQEVDQSEEGMGVKMGLREHLQMQEAASKVAIQICEKAKSFDTASADISKLTNNFANRCLSAGADDQWNKVVQHLPSVMAARFTTMVAQGVPGEAATKALVMIGEYDKDDVEVAASNVGILKRLGSIASPHPQTMQRAAERLRADRRFVGSPQDWYHGVDTTEHPEWMSLRPDLERAWMQGLFKKSFGGPKSGHLGIFSDEELFAKGYRQLFAAAVSVKDQLELLIGSPGEDGRRLRVEPRILIAFHTQGEVLPPWVDGLGTARRLSLTMHFSPGQDKVSDGGALRLTRFSDARDFPTVEVPAGGGHWCAFYTQEFRQAVEMVKMPYGRWSITACAEDAAVGDEQRAQDMKFVTERTKKDPMPVDNFGSMQQLCAACEFSGADGITMACPERHRVCRSCLQKEIRSEAVSTCPACVKLASHDRVYVADSWNIFGSDCIDDIGCMCPEGQTIDVGSMVVIAGQCKGSDLNGKLAEALWWEKESRAWECRVFATGRMVTVPAMSLHLAPMCPVGGSLSRCPCWPKGRGLYPVSLGCRCCVKQGILDCGDAGGGVGMGYPYFHGMPHLPFDWNLTSLEGVLFFLRHRFSHFFYHTGMKIVKAVNREDVLFDNYWSSMHAFIHHHPVKDAERIGHRFDRFSVICSHARDARGARPLLFIRYVHDSREFSKIDELYSLLRLWGGPHIRLCIVAMLQTAEGKEKLYRHARFPRVLIYLVGQIDVMDFEPIRQACRFAVYDEAGSINCSTMEPGPKHVKEFRDPYTTTSHLCADGDWLTDLGDRDPQFYPDCPQCAKPWQGSTFSSGLVDAITSGDVVGVISSFKSRRIQACPAVDPNAWDSAGKRPLHHAGELEKRKYPTPIACKIVAELLLAHADPNCRDFQRATATEHAQRSGASGNVCALLRAATCKECPPDALYGALAMVEEPQRSRLARIIGAEGLRPMGQAEFTWRNPSPDSEAFVEEIEDTIRSLERLPEEERKREMKKLLLQWHPDKNGDKYELATTVFQYLQANKDRIIKR